MIKKEAIIPPKYIILDKTSTLDNPNQSSNEKSKSSEQTSHVKNYCQPPLFCPDIDDLQLILLENNENFEKGKFEKTSDWEKRKATILNTIKLNENKTADDTLYFLTDGSVDGSFSEPNYNADKEMWFFDLKFKETDNATCLPIISPKTGQKFCLVSSRTGLD